MYEVNDAGVWWTGKEGDARLVANFRPAIEEVNTMIDAGRSGGDLVYLTVSACSGPMDDPVRWPRVSLSSASYGAMDWVMDAWGTWPLIMAGAGHKELLRQWMQLNSTPRKVRTYTTLGWHRDERGQPVYVTAGGAIGVKYDPSAATALPPELHHYRLPEPGNAKAVKANLVTVAKHLLGIGEYRHLCLAMVARAVLGRADFAVHISGKTGTFKSEMAAIFQSFWGPVTGRELACSWSSTSNALEALAWRAKDAILTVDDFVPSGTSYHVRNLTKSADQLFRGAGNQAGRTRLTDASALQATMYPRCLLLSTGEDIPEGHSLRARVLIVEIAPGDITPVGLTLAQGGRAAYAQLTADFVAWLAGEGRESFVLRGRVGLGLRQKYQRIGHARTPDQLGDLLASLTVLAEWMHLQGVKLDLDAATAVLVRLAQGQVEYTRTEDPCEMFASTIRELLSSKRAHLRAAKGTIPVDAELYGWSSQSAQGAMPVYDAHGPRMGWIDGDDLLIDVDALPVILRAARGKLQLSRATMVKRLKDDARLTETDATRGRSSVRRVCEHATRVVLCLSLDTTMSQDQD